LRVGPMVGAGQTEHIAVAAFVDQRAAAEEALVAGNLERRGILVRAVPGDQVPGFDGQVSAFGNEASSVPLQRHMVLRHPAIPPARRHIDPERSLEIHCAAAGGQYMVCIPAFTHEALAVAVHGAQCAAVESIEVLHKSVLLQAEMSTPKTSSSSSVLSM